MSFLFASSHLPVVKHPEEDEEEHNVQPMRWSGSVRAFSHLPVKRAAGDPAGPLSQRGAQAIGRQLQRTGPEELGRPYEDGIAAAKASGVFDAVRQQYNRSDSPHFMDEDGNLRPRQQTSQPDSASPRNPRSTQGVAGAPPSPAWSTGHAADSSRSPLTKPTVSEDTRPWYMPAITSEDFDPQFSDDADASSHSAPKGRPEAHDLVYRTPGASTPKPEFRDLLYRSNGSPEDAGDHRRDYFKNAAAAADAQDATVQQTAAKAGARQQDAPPAQSSPSAGPANRMFSNTQTPSKNQFAGLVINAADVRQTSGTKPDSGNADAIPSGMEYALKFIGGSLVDTGLNTAVALFGGPGKYSYNPNPLRRAWHVDGWLPKIDREAYNRLQDGAEMLAFSFTEATNPKNRIHLAVPAPAWRSGDGPPLSKKEAGRWLKEYHDNVKKTGSGDFQIGIENNLLKSRLINGTHIFDIARPTDDGMMSAKDMFKNMMNFYGPAVKTIQGNWVDGDNLAKINALTQGGTPLKSAVQMTWTGLEAARHGYTEVEINHSIGENRKYTDIQVNYRKPRG